MFIQVRLLKGFHEPLLYKVPKEWEESRLVGSIVRVPLRNRTTVALVEKTFTHQPSTPFTIKPAYALEPFPKDKHYQRFIDQLSHYYQVPSLYFARRIQQFLLQKEVRERKTSTPEVKRRERTISLTQEQQAVCSFMTSALEQQTFTPTLLHGVTGSGKTEVYKKLIEQTFTQKKTSILLLPEVTLAVQFAQLLKAELPDNITIVSFHSATSVKEKRQLWKWLLEGKPLLIIGVHLPILLPIANLGLIIVDEEHEVGYQEKKHPKINSKEAALMRAKLNNIPILLGSATPSLASWHNVKQRGWHLFELKQRFAGSFPTVKTVLLNDKKQRKQFWISRDLEKALADRLQKKEQSIIFINRRGYSFFVQCKGCSEVFSCTNCSVSLTLHSNNALSCHYCGSHSQLPTQCPSCKKGDDQFLKKGIGTQQVVTILKKMFPHARIDRADMDTTVNKKKWQQTVSDFEQGNLDILVGTQTITKGYHFPNVTLVGVLWADLNLNFPMFNAHESALQQLIQVAGRAGRQRDDSLVIVQSMIEHPLFAYLNEQSYPEFFAYEAEKRKLVGYPPYIRFAEIELKSTDEASLINDAHLFAQTLETVADNNNLTITVLGPAQPLVHKVKNMFMRKIYIKAERLDDVLNAYRAVDQRHFTSRIYFTPNPLT